ncbi:hypothetical protein MTO96_018917 [Rhipicephalus appendiculatus]
MRPAVVLALLLVACLLLEAEASKKKLKKLILLKKLMKKGKIIIPLPIPIKSHNRNAQDDRDGAPHIQTSSSLCTVAAEIASSNLKYWRDDPQRTPSFGLCGIMIRHQERLFVAPHELSGCEERVPRIEA